MAENPLANLSLVDLAGIDISDMAARNFGDVLPRCFANWEITKGELKSIDDEQGKPKMFMASWQAKCTGVHAVLDDGVDPASIVGREHTEIRVIKLPADIEMVKGFIEKVGVPGKGTLKQLIEACAGAKFSAQLLHQKDKNDPDRVYAKLDKIKVGAI